jgi:hypothetical protein
MDLQQGARFSQGCHKVLTSLRQYETHSTLHVCAGKQGQHNSLIDMSERAIQETVRC